MNILFLTQILPYPLDAGAKVRAYYTLRHLSRDNDVTLLSFSRDTDSPESVDHLRSFCRSVHLVAMRRSTFEDARHFLLSLIKNDSFLIRRDRSDRMAQAIQGVLKEFGPFHSVHSDQLWMAPYALMAKAGASSSEPPLTVLDQHNAVFQIPERMADGASNPLLKAMLRLEARKMARYEIEQCNQFDKVVFVSADDWSALCSKGLAPDKESHRVIPICVDATRPPVTRRLSGTPRITFIGGMHWPPNADGVAWFHKYIWPRIHEALPEAVFTAIGKNPPGSLKQDRSGKIEATDHLVEFDRYLEETAVTVVPLLAGGGVRVKILDAWSKGIPIVSTTIGAEGLRAQNGSNLMIADTPDEFAESVIRIVQDPELSTALVHEGHRTLQEHYDWRHIYSVWDEAHRCVSSSSYRTHPV